jgi:hypothetical protein
LDLLRVVHMLPGHRGAQLRGAHQLGGQGHVPGVEDRIAAGPRRGEHPRHALDRLGCVRQLAQHAGLHVVDDQGHGGRIASVLDGLRDVQAGSPTHQSPPRQVGSTPAPSLTAMATAGTVAALQDARRRHRQASAAAKPGAIPAGRFCRCQQIGLATRHARSLWVARKAPIGIPERRPIFPAEYPGRRSRRNQIPAAARGSQQGRQGGIACSRQRCRTLKIGCPDPSGLRILIGSSRERTGSRGREIPEVHS